MRVDEKNDGQIFEFFLDLDRGRGRDGDEKKNLQKKIFIAIAIATVTSTGTYKIFQIFCHIFFRTHMQVVGAPRLSEK
jgi:hypothetical protein